MPALLVTLFVNIVWLFLLSRMILMMLMSLMHLVQAGLVLCKWNIVSVVTFANALGNHHTLE